MNRRNFIKNILIAGASFNILPGAGRIWKVERTKIINPEWIDAPYENFFWFEMILNQNGITFGQLKEKYKDVNFSRHYQLS